MKRIHQLSDLLSFMIWSTLVIMGIAVFALLIALATGNFSNLNINIKGIGPGGMNAFQIIVSVLVTVGYVFFFIALFKMKHLVSCFVKRGFFTEKAIQLSKQIGSYFIITPIFLYVPPFVYESIAKGEMHISLNTVSPESFFFLIVIGLFFLTLGYIFQEAKNLKDENELTV